MQQSLYRAGTKHPLGQFRWKLFKKLHWRSGGDLKIQQEDTTRRLIFIIGAIAGITLINANPSLAAQKEPPWCLKAVSGNDLAVDLCYFRTFEQCAQERFNYGNTSFCFHNPVYFFNQATPGKQPRKSGRRTDQ